MTGSTWRFGSRCLCPVLSRMQGDGLLFSLHILLLLPVPALFSAREFRKGCDGTLYQEVKSGGSQLCFPEVKQRRRLVASERITALWEVGDQPVHTGGKAAGGSLIVHVCVCVFVCETVLAVVGVHLFPWEWVGELHVSRGTDSK